MTFSKLARLARKHKVPTTKRKKNGKYGKTKVSVRVLKGRLTRAGVKYSDSKRKSHFGKKRSSSQYRKVSRSKFCGPSGGAARGTYPVNTKKRCSAALSYARFAPRPCGIARCVNRKCPKSVGNSSKLMKRCVKSRFGYEFY